MNLQNALKESKKLDYAKALQDYQILWNAIITYWIALAVGLIISYITDRLVFDVFFVSVVSISAFGTILILFELRDLDDIMLEIKEGIIKEDNYTSS